MLNYLISNRKNGDSMHVSKLSKPFYLGAITLFATSTLAFTHPVISHAASNTTNSSIAHSLANADSTAHKDAYGLTLYDYLFFDHDAIANSSMPNDYKALYFGLSDGIHNQTRDTNYNNTSYQNGYIVGQTLAQGYLSAQKYGNKVNHAPYIKSFNDPDSLIDKQITAVYFGYLDGSNTQRAKDNNQVYRLQYLPTKDDMTKQLYLFGFIKGSLDVTNNVSVADNNQNQTPFGFNYSHLKELNMMRSIEHLPAVSTNDAPANALSNTDASTYYDGGNLWSTANYTLGIPESIMSDLFNSDTLKLPKSSIYTDMSNSSRLLNVTTTNATAFKTNPFLDFTSDAPTPSSATNSNTNEPADAGSNVADNDSAASSTNDSVTASSAQSSNVTSASQSTTSQAVSSNPTSPESTIVSQSSHHATKPAKKHIVKKHVTKKAVKKHSKKATKKHVAKKTPKKIRKNIPHTIYAKHSIGVHSSAQFNHGKTYYVAKGHKFHVYYKISDGHGNWRYNVGYHKFVTTISGSISHHYVKPAHHAVRHHHTH